MRLGKLRKSLAFRKSVRHPVRSGSEVEGPRHFVKLAKVRDYKGPGLVIIGFEK